MSINLNKIFLYNLHKSKQDIPLYSLDLNRAVCRYPSKNHHTPEQGEDSIKIVHKYKLGSCTEQGRYSFRISRNLKRADIPIRISRNMNRADIPLEFPEI